MKVLQADLWKYSDCEFVATVAGQKMRVILKSTDCKNAHISNYYHRAHVFKMKLSSFLNQFELVT